MGGHGGLNILPQKSWNVYGHENREKVKRDEEAQAEEEKLKRERQIQVEGEVRRQLLLERARKRQRTEEPSLETPPTEEVAQHVDLFSSPPEVVKGGPSQDKPKAKANPLQDEDPRMAVGAGLAGKGVAAPWYARPRGMEAESDEREKGGAEPRHTGAGSNLSVRQLQGRKGSTSGLSSDSKDKGAKGKKSIEELRAERVERERIEKERQRRLLLAQSAASGSGKGVGKGGLDFQMSAPSRRYNSGFGYGR